MDDLPELRQDLAHVRWMGGSPCSGKSSIARILAQNHRLRIYAVDEAFNDWHRCRLEAARQPILHKWVTTSWNTLWMQPQEILLAEAIAAYGEHFGLIVEDIASMPQSPPILAEGTALLPDLVSRVLGDRRRAIWVVPTEAFQRTVYPERGPWIQTILSQCADPELALRNWMDRDVAFGEWVAEQTDKLGLALLKVDGTRSIAENATHVARHFQLE